MGYTHPRKPLKRKENKMKKVFALAAAVVMIMAMATACGNNATSSETVGSSTTVSESSK